ncbi:hypothetical protein PGH26_02950 [Sporosarcina jeotgali]|uniref:Uncharacterized protein n=1 Tax=Sporosarcina jeotgali TaxID=3020056 RepID=A0ABZ0KZ50_9BACL|nr:hypothetical protein [Sporosarcina sp. B2O-1]WOV84898.1 hypothetical protein PGH26_02950 [Sporosarcina sp. B2O-1]
MRNFIVVLCTSLFLMVMPSVGYANETPQDQPEDKPKRGLVGGLLNQVKNTVDKTVKSTGELVDETVKFTGDTVERTVELTTGTVNTVVDPKQKPVKTIVENTTNFVGETVEKTVPVVEQTTKTVQTVTNETVKVTKPLPKVPVVTPVVDKTAETVDKATAQVKKTVDETAGTVAETVSKPLQKQPATNTLPAVGEKPNQDLSSDSSGGQMEQPSRPIVTEKPRQEQFPAAEENQSEIPGGTRPSQEKLPEQKPEADNETKSPAKNNVKSDSAISKDPAVSAEITQVNTYSTQGVKPIEEKFTVERKALQEGKQQKVSSNKSETRKTSSNDAYPLKPSGKSSWISNVQLITGSSSISVPAPSISSGISGVGAVISDDWLMKAEITRQKWYLEDIIGTLQWSHAPPGQPPQSTPFLYVI